jgi:hypothetical protein
MPDEQLYQIARDLRICELALMLDESVDPPITGVMFLIVQMFMLRVQVLTGRTKFEFPRDEFEKWMQRYMFYAERELVARALKMPCQTDTQDFVKEVDQKILSFRSF